MDIALGDLTIPGLNAGFREAERAKFEDDLHSRKYEDACDAFAFRAMRMGPNMRGIDRAPRTSFYPCMARRVLELLGYVKHRPIKNADDFARDEHIYGYTDYYLYPGLLEVLRPYIGRVCYNFMCVRHEQSEALPHDELEELLDTLPGHTDGYGAHLLKYTHEQYMQLWRKYPVRFRDWLMHSGDFALRVFSFCAGEDEHKRQIIWSYMDNKRRRELSVRDTLVLVRRGDSNSTEIGGDRPTPRGLFVCPRGDVTMNIRAVSLSKDGWARVCGAADLGLEAMLRIIWHKTKWVSKISSAKKSVGDMIVLLYSERSMVLLNIERLRRGEIIDCCGMTPLAPNIRRATCISIGLDGRYEIA
jgi:hypothetical protein